MSDESLPPFFISGFTAGEGCFFLNFRKDFQRKKNKTYYRWFAMFAIVLNPRDDQILHKIRNSFNCGQISYTTDRTKVRYQVADLNDLRNTIAPFFKKYPLYNFKEKDFKLWSQAVEILYQNKVNLGSIQKGESCFKKTDWNPADLAKIQSIHQKMQNLKHLQRHELDQETLKEIPENEQEQPKSSPEQPSFF